MYLKNNSKLKVNTSKTYLLNFPGRSQYKNNGDILVNGNAITKVGQSQFHTDKIDRKLDINVHTDKIINKSK